MVSIVSHSTVLGESYNVNNILVSSSLHEDTIQSVDTYQYVINMEDERQETRDKRQETDLQWCLAELRRSGEECDPPVTVNNQNDGYLFLSKIEGTSAR